MSIHIGGARGNRNCPKYLKAQYDAEPRVASRRVALRGVATRRVVHNFGDHARVRRTATTPIACIFGSVYNYTKGVGHPCRILALYLRQRRRRKCSRSMWICGIFTRRQQQGEYHKVLQEMRMPDPESHFRYKFTWSATSFQTFLLL